MVIGYILVGNEGEVSIQPKIAILI